MSFVPCLLISFIVGAALLREDESRRVKRTFERGKKKS